MTHLIVDASVAVKWLIEETDSDRAEALLGRGDTLGVPSHFHSELANALVSKVRRGQLAAHEAEMAITRILELPLAVLETRPLVVEAASLALAHGVTVYDSLYVALALDLGCQLVTADRRLREAIEPAFPGAVALLSEFAEA